MSDLRSQLQDYVETNIERVDIDDLASTLLAQPEARPQPQRVRRVWLTPPGGPVAVAGAAAMIVVLLIGAAWLLTSGGGDSPVITQSAASSSTVPRATTKPVPATTLPPTPEPPVVSTAPVETTVVPPDDSWNPILSTTKARPAPPAATCPAGTAPNVAGLIGQQRPHPGWVGNLAAAFDQHTGRIVYVDQQGETWTLDVCVNRWHQMNPNGSPADPSDLFDSAGRPSGILGPLVNDVDSDVTVALNSGYIAVYDANNNTWTRHSRDESFTSHGAVYDPASGLILTTRYLADDPPGPAQRWGLSAYDVDTNTWSTIGIIPGDIEQLDFLGYSQAIDRFIIVGFVDLEPVTVLLDPRTGETTLIFTETPIVDLGWPGAVYGPADDTVYVSDHDGRLTMCGFNTASLTWTCSKGPETVPSTYYAVFAAAVGDSINDRLVLINGVYGDWWSSAADDVWAIDLDTGEWTQILAPTSP